MKIPYPPSTESKECLEKMKHRGFSSVSGAGLRYPGGCAGRIYHMDRDEIFVGVGSDDVLAMCFLTFFNSGKPVFFPDITYSFYDVWADVFRIPYECQPLDKDFRIVKEDYYRENGGVVFPNPNAPTGILMELSESRISSVTIRT